MIQPEYVNDLVTKAFGKTQNFLSGAVGGISALGVSLSTMLLLKDSSSQFEVGSARNFSRTQNREVYKRRSLGTNSHQPFQIVPLAVDTNLMLERVVLYKNDVLKQAFGFWGESLMSQQMPFMIIESKGSPNGDLNQEAMIMYLDCWFTSNPVEYDIEAQDQLVIQDRNLEVGRVIVYDPTASGVVQAAETVLNIGRNLRII